MFKKMKKKIEVITPTFPWYRICNINLLGGGGGKDRSSSNSTIKSASIKTPTTKLTPPHRIKKEIEKPRKQPGRGRLPSKVNKVMQDSNVKNAFEVRAKKAIKLPETTTATIAIRDNGRFIFECTKCPNHVVQTALEAWMESRYLEEEILRHITEVHAATRPQFECRSCMIMFLHLSDCISHMSQPSCQNRMCITDDPTKNSVFGQETTTEDEVMVWWSKSHYGGVNDFAEYPACAGKKMRISTRTASSGKDGWILQIDGWDYLGWVLYNTFQKLIKLFFNFQNAL